MIVSILLGFIAAVLSLLGLKCTNIGISDEDGKMKFAVTGGFLFILGGNTKAEMRMLSVLCIPVTTRLNEMNTYSCFKAVTDVKGLTQVCAFKTFSGRSLFDGGCFLVCCNDYCSVF